MRESNFPQNRSIWKGESGERKKRKRKRKRKRKVGRMRKEEERGRNEETIEQPVIEKEK